MLSRLRLFCCTLSAERSIWPVYKRPLSSPLRGKWGRERTFFHSGGDGRGRLYTGYAKFIPFKNVFIPVFVFDVHVMKLFLKNYHFNQCVDALSTIVIN